LKHLRENKKYVQYSNIYGRNQPKSAEIIINDEEQLRAALPTSFGKPGKNTEKEKKK